MVYATVRKTPHGKSPTCFEIITPNRTYSIDAPSPTALEEWLKILMESINRYYGDFSQAKVDPQPSKPPNSFKGITNAIKRHSVQVVFPLPLTTHFVSSDQIFFPIFLC